MRRAITSLLLCVSQLPLSASVILGSISTNIATRTDGRFFFRMLCQPYTAEHKEGDHVNESPLSPGPPSRTLSLSTAQESPLLSMIVPHAGTPSTQPCDCKQPHASNPLESQNRVELEKCSNFSKALDDVTLTESNLDDLACKCSAADLPGNSGGCR
ncbi:hypothetical protein BC835DRAFT_708947 [Cytidiella melzeri]|nr:hypothetical protein BC835DRAFT_708947 [Cytidiella melzeri]